LFFCPASLSPYCCMFLLCPPLPTPSRSPDRSEIVLTRGDTLSLRYTYRDYDSDCAVSIFLDRDRNPYNDNSLATVATIEHALPTGSAIREFAVATRITELAPDGSTYLCAKITDGIRTRYLYGSPSFVAGDAPGCAGDFDGSGQVDFDDFFLFADEFGENVPPADPQSDLDADGTIDMDDFFLFADSFGQSCKDLY